MTAFPDDIDTECVPICTALSALPGVETFWSCCGHGDLRFTVFFRADAAFDAEPLQDVLRAAGSSDWMVRSCNNGRLEWIVQGSFGEQACLEADAIAAALEAGVLA